MSDLGDLFGGIGEFFGGLREARGEDAPAYLGDGEENAEGYDATTTVDRYLTGAPRALNVNDQ